jgi:hypothetical protein
MDECEDCQAKKRMDWQAIIDADPEGHRAKRKRKRDAAGAGT